MSCSEVGRSLLNVSKLVPASVALAPGPARRHDQPVSLERAPRNQCPITAVTIGCNSHTCGPDHWVVNAARMWAIQLRPMNLGGCKARERFADTVGDNRAPIPVAIRERLLSGRWAMS